MWSSPVYGVAAAVGAGMSLPSSHERRHPESMQKVARGYRAGTEGVKSTPTAAVPRTLIDGEVDHCSSVRWTLLLDRLNARGVLANVRICMLNLLSLLVLRPGDRVCTPPFRHEGLQDRWVVQSLGRWTQR